MSRIAKNSIRLDNDITCSFQDGNFKAKGKLGEMSLVVNLYILLIFKRMKSLLSL